MAKKVTPIAYSVDDTLRMDLVDDNGFSAEGVSFVVFSSSELPKNQKCYFEIIVTENPKREVCRFIPLYIGVHAEPANGILTSDFCIGSIYYTSELRIETWEKNTDSGYAKHYVVQNTYARTPINGTVIGCMADLKHNEISLYSDGKLYYTFRPRSFRMNNSNEKFYFCIFAKTLTKIAATVNYGNYPLKYKPNDAYSLTQYANRYKIHYDIDGWVKFSKDNGGTEDYYYENRMGIGEEFNATHVVENNIIPMTNPHRRDVWLTYADGTDLLPYKESYQKGESTANHYSYKDSKQSAYIHPGNQSIYDGDTVYRLNYPIGNDYPIYFELECKNGFLDSDYFGIPVMIGLGQEDTSSHLEGDTTYSDKIISFGLNLWHKKYNKNTCIVNLSYKYKPNGKNEVNITKYNTWDIEKTYNPLEPKQPDIIGILIDPITRSIKVYTQGMLYMEANLDDFLVIGRDDSKTQAKATEEFIASDNNTLINSYNKGFYMNKSPFTDKEKKEFVFTNPFKLSYIFIKPMYEVFDMSVDDLPMITLNLGSDIENVPFKYKIPTGAMSYWYYFNWLIRNLCHRDIECIFTALSYYINVNKSIRCTIHVSGSNKYNNPLEFSPGLNMMWGEYTNISDEEVHYNEPDIDPIEFRAMMDDRILEKVENKVDEYYTELSCKITIT